MATPQMLDMLESHYPLSEPFRSQFKAALIQKTYRKGQVLSPNKAFYSVWFINKGLAKGTCESQDGKEHITRFWQEGELMLLGRKSTSPSNNVDQIVLLEDCLLSSIQTSAMIWMYETLAETAKLASKILWEDIRKAGLKSTLCALPTLLAYKSFTELFPAERILLRDIAAYLEVTPSTLSEIRRKGR